MEGFMNFIRDAAVAITEAVIIPVFGKYWAQIYGILLFLLFATLLVLFIVFVVKYKKTQNEISDYNAQLSACREDIGKKKLQIANLMEQLEKEKLKNTAVIVNPKDKINTNNKKSKAKR